MFATAPEFAIKKDHFAALDWLRAIAAMSVFAHHFYQQYSYNENKQLGNFDLLMLHLGPWGVAIFFVLSGFCIHWARLTESARADGFRPKLFLVRRFFRIYPALLVTVVIYYIVEKFYTSNLLHESSLNSVFAHLALVSSFSVEHRVAVNNVLWTVVVECHFYLMYFLFWRFFDGIYGTCAVALVAICLGAATYVVSVAFVPSGETRVMIQSIFLASWWSWCLGAVIAQLVHDKGVYVSSVLMNRVYLFCLVFVSLAIALLPHPLDLQARRFTLPVLAAMILYIVLRDRFDFSKTRPIVFLGVVSYSLYLLHPMAILIGLKSGLGLELAAVLIFSAGILLAYLNYSIIEAPFVALGKRLVARYRPGMRRTAGIAS